MSLFFYYFFILKIVLSLDFFVQPRGNNICMNFLEYGAFLFFILFLIYLFPQFFPKPSM